MNNFSGKRTIVSMLAQLDSLKCDVSVMARSDLGYQVVLSHVESSGLGGFSQSFQLSSGDDEQLRAALQSLLHLVSTAKRRG